MWALYEEKTLLISLPFVLKLLHVFYTTCIENSYIAIYIYIYIARRESVFLFLEFMNESSRFS